MNLFDFDTSICDSHFVSLRILQYLLNRSNKTSRIGRGYIEINDLIIAAEDVSVQRSIIYDTLLRLSSFNLVEYDNQSRSDIKNASFVKITPAGKYYLNELIYEFSYLDPIITETPISNYSLLKQLKNLCTSSDIKVRLEKTTRFIDYLNNAEIVEMKDRPQYVQSELTNLIFSENIRQRHAKFVEYIQNKR
jgi:hypothetical protein